MKFLNILQDFGFCGAAIPKKVVPLTEQTILIVVQDVNLHDEEVHILHLPSENFEVFLTYGKSDGDFAFAGDLHDLILFFEEFTDSSGSVSLILFDLYSCALAAQFEQVSHELVLLADRAVAVDFADSRTELIKLSSPASATHPNAPSMGDAIGCAVLSPKAASGEDGRTKEIDSFQIAPIAEDAPCAEAAPLAEAAPCAEAGPIAEDAPCAEAGPLAEDAPCAEAAPLAEAAPCAEAGPIAEDAPCAEAAPLAEHLDLYVVPTRALAATILDRKRIELNLCVSVHHSFSLL